MPTPIPPKQALKSDPLGRFDGKKMKNHELIHIPHPQKKTTPTQRCGMCIQTNIKKLDLFARSVVFLSIQKAATHDIIH
jgi:hypothetical protein